MNPPVIISKIVRPATLFWSVFLFSALAISDGNFGTFTVKEIYVTGLIKITEAIIWAYVLGRSGEKITGLVKGAP